MDFLSQEQISEFKEAFTLFDVEKTGSLSKTGLKNVMRQLGLKPTDEEVAQMISDSGSKKDITFESFVSMMADKMSKMDTPQELNKAFSCFDVKGQGYILDSELRRVLTEYGHGKFNDKEIREIVKMGDPDEDGYIDYERLTKKLLASN